MGTGVTILERKSLEQIHHFTGMRCIHGGFFVSEDVLLVYTGEQRLYFLQISTKSVLWECRRPRELAVNGDMGCCLIPGTETVACIARGKKSLEEHYFLVADYKTRNLSLRLIPDVYRVALAPVWTEGIGLNFLSFQAKGDGKMLNRITALEQNGDSRCLYEWESEYVVKAYFGKGFFASDYSGVEPRAYILKIRHDLRGGSFTLDAALPISLPVFYMKNPLGGGKYYLPDISMIDGEKELLSAHSDHWMGVYELKEGKLLREYELDYPSCATIIDERLIIGCTPGLMVDSL